MVQTLNKTGSSISARLPKNPFVLGFGRVLKLLFVGGVCAFVIVYLLLSPLCSKALYHFLLFHPVKYPIGCYDQSNISGVQASDEFFKSVDGTRLHGWLFKKPGARYVVVVHHGQGGNLTSNLPWLKLLLDENLSVFAYDYRSFGRSEGKCDVPSLLKDGEAACKHALARTGLDNHHLIQCGLSLGTGVAAELSARQSGAATILVTPYTNLVQAGFDVLPMLQGYPRFMFYDMHIGAERLAKAKHGPLLIVHGTADEMIPVRHADELSREAGANTTYLRIAGGSHNVFSGHEKIIDETVKIFVDKLPRSL
jgi:uncharacterized protein